jgi:septal ring-binding cell division protein DamX
VSAVETPPAAAPETAPRQCPRCGARLTPDQEWCLSCGTGVGAHVAAPRGWRWPLAVVGTLLALALLALVLALVELAGDAEQVGTQPAPPVAATPAPTPAATTTAVPTATPDSGGAPAPSGAAEWPAGKTGYTVVLESSSTRSAADTRASELAAQGIATGVLDSSGYASLTPDRFVVFSGQYETRAEARAALQAIKAQVAGAQVKRVAPA